MLCFSIPTPGFPHFHYILGANSGSLLHGDVSAMMDIFVCGVNLRPESLRSLADFIST